MQLVPFTENVYSHCLCGSKILNFSIQEAETFAQEQDFGTKEIKEIAIKICNLPKQNEKRPRVVILTQGTLPVILAENGKIREFPVKALPEEQLVDTNGAGDAFTGKL